MTEKYDSVINRLTMWKETYELSFELADVTFVLLNTVVDYCKKHSIPIYKEEGLWSLVRKARFLFKEIEKVNSTTFKSRKLPFKNSDKRKPDKLPKPRTDKHK